MREPPDVMALVASLCAASPDVMSRDEFVTGIAQIAEVHAWADAVLVQFTRGLRKLAEEGRAEAPRDAIAKHGRQTGKGARDADERERVCDSLPNFEEALGAGAVSSGHVDAIAHATKNLDEATLNEFNAHADDLLRDAERTGVDAFERNCRELARLITANSGHSSDTAEYERQVRDSRVKRWTDRDTGQKMTLLAMYPLRDAKWWAGVNATRKRISRKPGGDKLPWDQLMVDAVVDAAQGDGGQSVTQLHVLIDYETLLERVHAKTVCELDDGTQLPVALVRQLAGELEVIPIVLNGKGQALDVGRSQRLATEAQRQAMRSMHRTCGDPDCDCAGEDCEAHHIKPFSEGGRTDLRQLIWLCKKRGDHTKYHEGGWTMTIDAERNITITRPDGVIHYRGPSIDRAPNGVAA